MNREICFLLAFVLAIAAVHPSSGAASAESSAAGEESRLIAMLEGSASSKEKMEACARLKLMGTPAAVPALAHCVGDEQLFQPALDALQMFPGKEVNAALRAILSSASGQSRLAVIHALGERRDPDSTAILSDLLTNTNEVVAAHAANALGKIGGPSATKSLQSILDRSRDPLRDVVVDALLHCAEAAASRADPSTATAIYDRLNATNENQNVRAAAYAGHIRTAANAQEALELILRGLGSEDPARVQASLALSREIPGPEASTVLANFLTNRASVSCHVSVLGVLQQRADAAALPAVLNAARSPAQEIRIAALYALGTLPGPQAIALLAQAAAAGTDDERKAARLSLIRLRGSAVPDLMVAQLAGSSPAIQSELILALASRQEKQVVSELADLARAENKTSRAAAFKGLTALAGPQDIRKILPLLLSAQNEVDRQNLREVFAAIAERAGGQLPQDTRLASAMLSGEPAARMLAIEVAGAFIDAEVRDAVRLSMNDQDARIRETAVMALATSRDPNLMTEKLELARAAKEPRVRRVAFESYVRCAVEPGLAVPPETRLHMLRQSFDLADKTDERRLVLSVLPDAPYRGVLDLALLARRSQDVGPEAEIACAKIAEALFPSEPDAAVSCLELLAREATASATRTDAAAVLNRFFGSWSYAGPFRREGTPFRDLLEAQFPPENPNDSQTPWLPVPGGAEFLKTGSLDLSPVAGGNPCVIYLKTCVFVPDTQEVSLRLGSDDGIKLWCNQQLVHTNNTDRGLAPGQDAAKTELRAGWNSFLAKISQNAGGCGFALQVVTPNGTPVAGLKYDARCQRGSP